MKPTFLVVDIRVKQNKGILRTLSECYGHYDKVLSLTPYSCYLLDQLSIQYVTYSELIDQKLFISRLNKDFDYLRYIINNSSMYLPLRYDISKLICFSHYVVLLINYLKSIKNDFHLSYIGDLAKTDDMNVALARLPQIQPDLFDQIKWLHNHLKFDCFYQKIKFKILVRERFPTFKRVKQYINQKIFNLKLQYDNKQLKSFFIKLNPVKPTQAISFTVQDQQVFNRIKQILIDDNKMPEVIAHYYKQLFTDFNAAVKRINKCRKIKINAFSFLSGVNTYALKLLYNINKIPVVITQHGSYVHENQSLLSNEILSADVNLVLNEYTKDLFLSHGAKNIKIIYSNNLNYQILKRKKYQYDFLYIAYCSSYAYLGAMIPTVNLDSIADSVVMYKRHRAVIELFGKKFSTLRLCIKVLPNFIQGGLYVPLEALAKKYKNITIEYIKPLKKLINQSENIISDYFSSDFINRDIHLLKNIILFSHSPFSIKKDDYEKLAKMFILCRDEIQLETILTNFNEIVQHNVRDLKIIEYFSSKPKSSTSNSQKIVKQIFSNFCLGVKK